MVGAIDVHQLNASGRRVAREEGLGCFDSNGLRVVELGVLLVAESPLEQVVADFVHEHKEECEYDNSQQPEQLSFGLDGSRNQREGDGRSVG